MARISIMDQESVAPELRKSFQKMAEQGRRVLNIFKTMAHCPEVGYYFLRLGNAILFK
jgi:hypothetical protein